LDFELALRVVREFAAGGGAKRGSTGLVPLDCLRSLFEALGAHSEAQGIELLEFMRRRALPSAQIAQLQGALNDGKRHAETNPVASGGAAAMSQANMDPYAQWQGANACYVGQQYPTDCYQQYQTGYQQQMGQMPYHPTMQLPVYQGGAPAAFTQQQAFNQQQNPFVNVPMLAPTFPATVPQMTPNAGIMGGGIMGTGSLLPAPGQIQAAALPTPGATLPTVLPSTASQPEVAVAVAPGLVPAPSPAATQAPAVTTTPAATDGTTKTAKSRSGATRRGADKENAAPAPQRAKDVPILGQAQAQARAVQ
jgi:hypothetical protein